MTDTPNLARLRLRAELIRTIRQFFWQRAFLEVDTPVALTAPAPERHIHAIPITLHPNVDGAEQVRFLQTSPELPMKRLLAALQCDIFQLAPTFRDEAAGPLHLPEFRLLEWYRLGADEYALMEDCEQLWQACIACLQVQPGQHRWQERLYDTSLPFARLRVDDIAQTCVDLVPSAYPEQAAFYAALKQRGIYCQPEDSWDELFHRLWLSKLEPYLTQLGKPVFVTHFPAALASLAALEPDNPAVARRFEWFFGAVELANGFVELTSSDEQRRRFVAEQNYRAARQQILYPLDETFLHALDSIGQAAGIALGIERLLVVLLDATSIDDVTCLKWNQT